jgi:hypothetical protein
VSGRRYGFVIDAHPDADALVRVLTPFAVQGAVLSEVSLMAGPRGLSIRLETEGLDEVRAGVLLERLRNLPVVIRAGLGWREAASAA